MMELTEKQIDERYIYKGEIINLKAQEVILPNGKKAMREIVEHPGAVAVIPVTEDGRVILIEQFRKAINSIILEIPAGKLHSKEYIEDCGRRELKEETGYEAQEFKYLGKLAMAPGFADEIVHVFKAGKLTKGEVNWDDDEFINLKEFSVEEINDLIRSGKIIDAKTVAAMTLLSLDK